MPFEELTNFHPINYGQEASNIIHMCTENSQIEKLAKLLEPLASKKLNLHPTQFSTR